MCFRSSYVVNFFLLYSGFLLATDADLMLGYGPVNRVKSDHWDNSMIITDPLQQAALWGKVTGWQYYARNTDPVHLQIWRLTITSGYWYYTLIGSTEVTPKAAGFGEVMLSRSEQFDISFGDVLGLSFPKSNPIPFSRRKPCQPKNIFKFVRNNVTATPGHKPLPIVGDSQWDPCRYYSFRAILSCNPANSSGFCYEKFVQERCRMANPIVLASSSGELASHSARYEQHYYAGLQCGIEVTVPKGSRIRIEFPSFQLTGTSGECNEKVNYMKVYEGSGSSGSLLGWFCGNSIPNTVLTCENKAYLYFYTDTVGLGGFNFTYSSEPEEYNCGKDDSAIIIAAVLSVAMILIIIAVALALYLRHRRKRRLMGDKPKSPKKRRHSTRVDAVANEYTGPCLMIPASDYYDRPPAYIPMGGADQLSKVVRR